MQPFLLLVLIQLLALVRGDSSGESSLIMASGEMEVYSGESGGGNECVASADVQREANYSSEEDAISAARCYLACVETDHDNELEMNRIYPLWPNYVLPGNDCPGLQKFKECQRGCFLMSRMEFPTVRKCKNTCYSECEAECDGNLECTHEGDVCSTKCNRGKCEAGCRLYERFTSEVGIPPSPVAAPQLLTLEDSRAVSDAGLYHVNLSHSMPSTNSSNEADNATGSVFVYRIHDLEEDEITYLWQLNALEPLSLTAFSCKEVAVAFAVVNKHGPSHFSPKVNISVYGAERKFANPVRNLRIEEEEDTRVGFFGHVNLTVTWDHSENKRHLHHYVVEVCTLSSSDKCGSNYCSEALSVNTISHTISASNPSDLPVMKYTYDIRVVSVSEDGEQTFSKDIHTVREFDPECIEFHCSRLWDPQTVLFSFNMAWVIPAYVAYGNSIREFRILRTLNERDLDFGPETIAGIANETLYTHTVSGTNFHPRHGPSDEYIFKMTIIWNQPELLYVPPTYHYVCNMNATSPSPGPVQNLSFTSYVVRNGGIELINFTWSPPTEANGRLKNYQACVWNTPYTVHDDFCITIPDNGTLYFAWHSPSISRMRCHYFYMRAYNDYVPGNWTVPRVIPADVDGVITVRCTQHWKNRSLSVNVSWSIQEPRCNEIERPFLGFVLWTELLNTTDFVIAQYNSTTVTAEEIQREYSYLFEGYEPQVFGNYRFVVYVDWNENLLYPSEAKSNSCLVDAIPPFPSATSIPTIETAPEIESQSSLQYGVAGGCVIAAFGLVVVVVTVLVHYKLRKRKRILEKITEGTTVDPMFTRGPKKRHAVGLDSSLTTDEWEVPPGQVIVEDCLGEGAFGEVYKGIIRGAISNPKIRPALKNNICTPVAIKLLKLSAGGQEKRDFLKEIEMMKKVAEGQNPHVVSLIACVTIQEPLCLITEYVRHGDLLTYLRTNRKLYMGGMEEGCSPYYDLGKVTSLDLISFAYQIASGMEYLSSLGVVHRDLACRNILVDEGKVLKITDFGMSRETNEVYVQKTKGRVPLKWMAIESIVTRAFTAASDVWAYGVVLWEIGTLGGFPYPSIQNEDLLSLLRRGYRMEKPDNCSPEVYEIMLECWNEDPQKRPTFSNLRDKFDAMLLAEKKDAYIDLKIDADKPYYKLDPGDAKDFLQVLSSVSPATKRKSHISADVSMWDFEKSPNHTSTPASLQNSPRPSRKLISPHSLSPAPTKGPRPLSVQLLRSEQPRYVEHPSGTTEDTLTVPSDPKSSRRASAGNLDSGNIQGSGIHITVTTAGPQ